MAVPAQHPRRAQEKLSRTDPECVGQADKATLYSAGEMGSIWGFLYQSGGNLAECLGLGRIVGFNAAAESPVTLEV
jgi:hypothetical protein